MPTFSNAHNYKRFIKTLIYYQIEGLKPKFSIFTPTTTKLNTKAKIVNIVCYVLMPNHFHLLLQQVKDGGIQECMSRMMNSYTKYYNTKYERVGPLFQGQFKAVLVESDEQLIHLSRYVHLNPISSFLTNSLESYRWSSYHEYITGKAEVCETTIILDQFSSIDEYKRFLIDQIDYAKSIEAFKHKIIDYPDV